MLEIEALSAGYGGGLVLQGLSMSVGRGEVAALLGRNGMGKTTLLRCVMGLVKPDAGVIRFAGARIDGRETFEVARAGVALVPQGREIIRTLTVSENLRLGALRGGALAEAFALFPALAEKADQSAASLSGGQQQQLAIARALLMNPKLLLLDEPSEGIQPSIVADIAALVARIAAERGIAVLIVEQNTALALSLASRAHFLTNGQITSMKSAAVTPAILAEHMGL